MPQPLRTYKIITERTLIRCYEAGDGALLKKSVDESVEHLLPWMIWAKYEPETVEKKEERIHVFREKYLNHQDYTLGIFNHNETELLGSTGFHTRHTGNVLEIGYWVNVNYARKGIITEVVLALTKVGFDVEGLNKLVICCEEGNEASMKVARKCGYTYTERDVTEEEPPRTLRKFELKKEDYLLQTSIVIEAFDIERSRLL